MPFSDKDSNDDAETLVDTLTIEDSTLNEANLSNLTTTDIQQLAELSQELHLSGSMETDESEVIIEGVDENSGEVVEEVMQTELGAQEIEIETERPQTPEEILPDVKVKQQQQTTTTTQNVVPPLRPLSIAPKPTKVPIAMKPIAAGQQLLLLQGGGSNQTIKLVSSQGQELNLANFSLGRPVAIKPAVKSIATNQSNISLVQPKQVVMKKIVTSATQKQVTPKSTTTTTLATNKQGQTIMVMQKYVPQQTTTTVAQQPTTPKKHTVLLNKPHSKTIKIVPTPTQIQMTGLNNQKSGTTVSVGQNKQPMKILPATPVAAATNTAAAKMPQRILFKTSGAGQTILPTAQIIQVAGTQALSTGQLHQINIPGKGMQYIKFVTASNADTTPSAVATSVQSSTPTAVLTEVKSVASANASLTTKTLKSIAAKSSGPASQVVMLPSFVSSQINTKVPIPLRHTPIKQENVSPNPAIPEASIEANGMRPRKPCNCTKSQCLKLYCDCFANGEFCYMCNCMNCYNNLENEDHRQRAIKTCLERNPNAFRPKIGKAKDVSGDTSIRKHTKGCNCKRSGCLKNYCECYEAKIACSNNCKCVGCRNIEDTLEKKGVGNVIEDISYHQHPTNKILSSPKDNTQFRSRRSSNSRLAINFITDEVIEATSQCMLTISHSGEAEMQDEELTKNQIIEEFGRCLTEIINFSSAHN